VPFVCHYRSLTRFTIVGLLIVSGAGCRTLGTPSNWFVASTGSETVGQETMAGDASEAEATEDPSVTLAFQQLAAARQQQMEAGIGAIAKVSHGGNKPIVQSQASTTIPGVGGWSPMADIP
jgi:hypothetical protein